MMRTVTVHEVDPPPRSTGLHNPREMDEVYRAAKQAPVASQHEFEIPGWSQQGEVFILTYHIDESNILTVTARHDRVQKDQSIELIDKMPIEREGAVEAGRARVAEDAAAAAARIEARRQFVAIMTQVRKHGQRQSAALLPDSLVAARAIATAQSRGPLRRILSFV